MKENIYLTRGLRPSFPEMLGTLSARLALSVPSPTPSSRSKSEGPGEGEGEGEGSEVGRGDEENNGRSSHTPSMASYLEMVHSHSEGKSIFYGVRKGSRKIW